MPNVDQTHGTQRGKPFRSSQSGRGDKNRDNDSTLQIDTITNRGQELWVIITSSLGSEEEGSYNYQVGGDGQRKTSGRRLEG